VEIKCKLLEINISFFFFFFRVQDQVVCGNPGNTQMVCWPSNKECCGMIYIRQCKKTVVICWCTKLVSFGGMSPQIPKWFIKMLLFFL